MALVLGLNSNTAYTDHGDLAAMNSAPALTVAFWNWVGVVVAPGEIAKSNVSFFAMNTGREYRVRHQGVWSLITPRDTIVEDIYAHYAMVYDGTLDVTTRVKVYKNAASLPLTGMDGISPQGSVADATAGTTLPDMSGNGLLNGNTNSSGDFAHYRVWSAALSQAEVAQEMHRYWANRRTDLLFDAPYDDQLYARDYSGNGNHGTWNPINGTPEQRQGPPVSYGGKVLVTG